MSGDIEVRNLFDMRGRGAVAIGYLREGTVRVGQWTRPLAFGALRLALTPGTVIRFEDDREAMPEAPRQ